METTSTQSTHQARLAHVARSLVRKVQAGEVAPLVRFARRVSERQAGGFVTVLPVELAAATFLRHHEAGTLTTTEGEAVRSELATSFLAGLGA